MHELITCGVFRIRLDGNSTDYDLNLPKLHFKITIQLNSENQLNTCSNPYLQKYSQELQTRNHNLI